jgi:hypothetical protein
MTFPWTGFSAISDDAGDLWSVPYIGFVALVEFLNRGTLKFWNAPQFRHLDPCRARSQICEWPASWQHRKVVTAEVRHLARRGRRKGKMAIAVIARMPTKPTGGADLVFVV